MEENRVCLTWEEKRAAVFVGAERIRTKKRASSSSISCIAVISFSFDSLSEMIGGEMSSFLLRKKSNVLTRKNEAEKTKAGFEIASEFCFLDDLSCQNQRKRNAFLSPCNAKQNVATFERGEGGFFA